MTNTELTEIRKALGYTQAELADILGVTRNTVSRWELGSVPIPPFLGRALQTVPKKKKAARSKGSHGDAK